MIKALLRDKKINNGKDLEIIYPMEEEETKTQVEEIFFEGQYKDALKKKDAVIVDVGANIGLAAIYFYDIAKKIYCLEPNPTIYDALVYNTKGRDKIQTYNMGISIMDGVDKMHKSNESPAQTFFDLGKSQGTTLVRVTPLDKFMEDEGIEHVDILKIDTEGAEYLILPHKSFERVADKINMIIGEAHFSGEFGFPEVIPSILAKYGFKTRWTDFENMQKVFTYQQDETGETDTYNVKFKTIFVAER